jgi:hypothetical protein
VTPQFSSRPAKGEAIMTKRIGNKDEAQQRSKEEKAATRRTNIAREAVKKAVAKTKYRNEVKNQPGSMHLPPA